ncbi:MAG TPA: hypothetical protein VF911_21045, partial [Thermoanaerobaculia bacterium]
MFVVPRFQIVLTTVLIAAAVSVRAGDAELNHIRASNFTAPLSFERNEGQADSSVRFMARGSASTILFRSADILIHSGEAGTPVRMQLVGSDPASPVVGDDPLPNKSHYFRGSDASQWRRNVANYAKVRYEQAYRGISAVFYGKDGQLEYDFLVEPGADPRTIRLAFSGQRGLSIDESGDLLIATDSSTVRQTKPVAYQTIGGKRRSIEAHYIMNGMEVGFAIAAYDKRLPLVIDPVLAYSSYFGGAGEDRGNAIAVRKISQSETHVYVAGSTTSLDIPNTEMRGAFAGYTDDQQPRISRHAQRDVFVAKFVVTDAGVTVAYTTYLGDYTSTFTSNSNYHEATAIAVTAGGEVVVAGNAQPAFVTTNGSFQKSAKSEKDCFVAKLSADGYSLVYSTFLGGSGVDELRGLAVTASGEAIVTGKTMPSGTVYDFPGGRIPDSLAPKPTLSGAARGKAEAFVVMLQAGGNALVYAHHLGGAEDDEANGVAVGADGVAYVVGSTNSTDIPGTGGFQPTNNGGRDGFVLKLDSSGNSLFFSYLGTANDDTATAVAVDTAGQLHVVGNGILGGG